MIETACMGYFVFGLIVGAAAGVLAATMVMIAKYGR